MPRANSPTVSSVDHGDRSDRPVKQAASAVGQGMSPTATPSSVVVRRLSLAVVKGTEDEFGMPSGTICTGAE